MEKPVITVQRSKAERGAGDRDGALGGFLEEGTSRLGSEG